MSTPILKSLKAEPGDEPDLSAYEPEHLDEEGRKVWDYYARNTPFWWAVSDLITVERYCTLVSVSRQAKREMDRALARDDDESGRDYTRFYGVFKSASLELKAAEYQLGLTPQGRAALKLPTAAAQVGREDDGEQDQEVLDPDDL